MSNGLMYTKRFMLNVLLKQTTFIRSFHAIWGKRAAVNFHHFIFLSFPQMFFTEFSEFIESWLNPKILWLPEIIPNWQHKYYQWQ